MRRTLAGLLLAATALTSACTGMPESGPVVDADVSSRVDQDQPSDISAAPPVPGASATDIVRGFLEAMTASPISSDVARQFLTAQAAERWDPHAATITYADDKLTPQAVGLDVTVSLTDAVRQGRTGILDAFFLLYAEAARRDPKPFLDWVRDDYDEAALRESYRARPWADLVVDRVLRRE